MAVNLIVAVGKYVVGKGYPIGKNGKLPWRCPADMTWFKETTMGHPVIMGRKTWMSLPKPLPGRINIVVTSGSVGIAPGNPDNVYSVTTIKEAIEKARELSSEDPFIIGGASIYKSALEQDLVDNIYMDYLSESCDDADAFFNFNDVYWVNTDVINVDGGNAYAYIYSRVPGINNHVDEQYFDLVRNIIMSGEKKDTRAGKTRSVFGRQLRFDLKEGLPILTTKKMFSKGVIHELLWFLSGNTNIKYLVDNGVHIWDDDAYRYCLELCNTKDIIDDKGYRYRVTPITKEDFIEKVKCGNEGFRYCDHNHTFTLSNVCMLPYYKYGDLNRVYGAQWTNWGGHNQIQEVIDTLKTNPDDRRMIVSAWNVAEIPDMALPPCHYCCQFYTRKMTLSERRNWRAEHLLVHFDTETLESEQITTMDSEGVPSRKLSCMWNQRSVDCGLGLGFNILSYSLLTHMVAQCVNMDVDELVFNGGDCHVYENHIEMLEEQLSRNPHKWALPTLVLNPDIKNIFDFKYEDITIEGYQSYPAIKMPLSVGL